MTGPRLIDAIDRLFDELVRHRWSGLPERPARAPAEPPPIEVELPVAAGQLGDVSVAREGRQVVVRARIRDAAGGGAPIERLLTVPPDAEVRGLEACVEGETLRVRVLLERRRP